MIRINLARSAGGKAAAPEAAGMGPVDSSQQDLQRQGFMRLIIFALGPLLLWLWHNNLEMPQKNIELAKMQKRLDEIAHKNQSAASAVAEMKNFESDEARLKSQIDVIESLRLDRLREVKLLDVVQRQMPERMWLTHVELRDGRLGISGMAGSDADLTQFMDSLSHSGLTKEVNLVSTREMLLEGSALKEFKVDCQFAPAVRQAGGPS